MRFSSGDPKKGMEIFPSDQEPFLKMEGPGIFSEVKFCLRTGHPKKLVNFGQLFTRFTKTQKSHGLL
jgi:hypothetical protein